MTNQPVIDFDGDHGRDYREGIRRSLPGFDALYEMTGAILAGAPLPDNARLLIVGCGGGEELCRLAEAHRGWRFTGVDPSIQMLDNARAAAAPFASRCAFHHGTVDDLPPSEPFDAATSLLVIHFLKGDEAQQAFLRSIAERLKPKAAFLLAAVGRPDPAHHGSPPHQLVEEGWIIHAARKGIPIDDFRERRKKIASEIDPVDEARLQAHLAAAGFAPAVRYHTGFPFAAWATIREG